MAEVIDGPRKTIPQHCTTDTGTATGSMTVFHSTPHSKQHSMIAIDGSVMMLEADGPTDLDSLTYR